MPTITDSAVCIRRWDFSETSQTVGLFAREFGMLRGIAKGAKREKGAFSGGIDLLTRGQIVAIVKPGRDLATLTQWTLEELFPAVRSDLRANRAALYIADLLHHLLEQADPHPDLFDALVDALRAFAEPGAIDPALLRFQWALLRETGYQPQLDRDAQTGRPITGDTTTVAFSPSAGGIVEDTRGGDRWRVRRETIDLIRRVAGNDAPAAPDLATIDRANRLLAAYLREMIGQEPAAMRWMFGDLRV